MNDAFALLGLPRRPGIDVDRLGEEYFRLAARWHPDGPEGDAEQFRALQEARRTLLDPAARVRHLLTLEGDEAPPGAAAQPPAEVFLEVASALDAAGKVTAAFQRVRSAIARAGLTAERAAARARILTARDILAERRAACSAELAAQDAAWPDADRAALYRIAGELAFFSRWDRALEEARFALENPPS